jgi:type I restriction enzyme, S subunit
MLFKLDRWLNWNFNIPPFSEQKKIVEILSTWDRAIDVSRKLVRNSESRRLALLQALLNGKAKLPGFASTKWPEIPLAQCAESLDNKRKPLNDQQRATMEGRIPYYGANGVVDYINEYLFDEPIVLLAEDGGYFDEFSTRPIAQLVYGKCWVNNHAHILRPMSNTTVEWLYYSLVHRNILDFINSGTRSKLNKADMLRIPIPVPSLEEQRAICQVFATADSGTEVVRKRAVSLQMEKRALIHQLLTGKRRSGVGHVAAPVAVNG